MNDLDRAASDLLKAMGKNDTEYGTKSEKRDKRKQNARKMKVSGASNKLTQKIIGDKARKLKNG